MKVAFLTETQYQGKWPHDFNNIRTEIAWQITLDADHFNIHNYEQVKSYDVVFIIFPKATVKLNMVGVEMSTPDQDKDISIYSKPIVEVLKNNNSKVCYIQEGPSYLFNDYDMVTQFNFYNQLSECDIIFAHNEYDIHFYKGLFPQTKIHSIPSLMFPINIIPVKEEKAVIGGNFARWYGGFQSFIVATEFHCPVFVPASHCKRIGEEKVPGLQHMPWVMWNDWMKHLSTFKYAVNLMPTIAAGTFSLNCAYFGIPCIGNEKVDTQIRLFPELSVDVNDIHQARFLAAQLKNDLHFYEHVSAYARQQSINSLHVDKQKWLTYITDILKPELEKILESKKYEEITVIFTSCGRYDLMKETLNSFLQYNTYPIKKYIVIDNSAKSDAKENMERIFNGLNVEIIINEENIGQVSSIDKAYSKINTEYIFHCEDDWQFFDSGFIEKSLSVLKHDKNLINVSVRVRFDGERGSLHPITDAKKTADGTVYHEYITNYLGAWHGFSWNPGLRRLSDYNSIKPYKQYNEESGVGKKYFQMEKRSACLEKFYCRHIGQNSTTEKRNI